MWHVQHSPDRTPQPVMRSGAWEGHVNGEIVAEHIAIVGMACRFPGAANLIEFWSNLAGGVESIRSFSEAALLAAGVDPEVVRDPAYVRRAAALDDVESFDAALFGLTAREAELL